MFRFSLIVPIMGSEQLFDDTLASVLRYRPPQSQVIVVHDGTYHDPYGLGREVDLVPCSASQLDRSRQPSLIGLFNDALPVARGEVVGLLRPGIQLDESWDAAIEQAFHDPQTACVAPAIVTPNQPNCLVTAGVQTGFGWSRRLSACGKRFSGRAARNIRLLGPSSWCGFYRRSILSALGACDSQLDDCYLDLDLALSIQNLNMNCVFCSDCVVSIDDPQLMMAEAKLAHGVSAQRAGVRHGAAKQHPSVAQTLLTALMEVAISGLRPSRLAHACQRLGAAKYADSDRLHQELIALLNSQRSRLLERTLRVHPPAANSNQPIHTRRAA